MCLELLSYQEVRMYSTNNWVILKEHRSQSNNLLLKTNHKQYVYHNHDSNGLYNLFNKI